MKKMNMVTALTCVCYVLIATASFGQTTVSIQRDTYLDQNPACPKKQYQYWVDRKPDYGVYEWKITGGYFVDFGQKTSQITRVDVPYVTVEWNNISHKDAKTAPVGHITLKINHKIISSRVVAKGTRSQEIYSLKDVIPQGLECRPSTTSIAYGEKEIKVYLTGGYLYFPGITKNGQRIPVLRYEWKIPKGWKLKSGQQPTPSGTYIVNGSVVELITNEDGGGDVCVRGLGGGSYDACVDSDIYSSYSNKLTFTRSGSLVFVNYPSNIRLGEVKTYEFSVRMDGVSSFDWSVPPGWKINGKTGTYRGGNSVQITTGKCRLKKR